MKNKIGWCSMTFNPAWGCRNKCPYCYARRIAGFRYDRIAEKEYKYIYHRGKICQGEFANRLKHFVPTFIESNFNIKFPQKTQKIFVGSMSEIAHWREEWVEKVIEKVKQYPQHTFQFLTKFPQVYLNFDFPKNCWLGVTIVEVIDSIEWMKFKTSHPDNIKFICLEPLIRPAMAGENSEADLKGIDWVIIGAETGNRKGKVIPKKEWIENIVNYSNCNNVPVYLKDSLKGIYPEEIKMFQEVK